ncbi:toprim domain-containing protein [Campylobacter coli]
MKLFIAEKPELGRAIAEGLDGNYKSGEGYIQKGDNIVTWAFGHILELAKPEEYDEKYKLWKLEDLCRRKNKISIWKNKTSIKVEILFFYKP